MLILGWRFHSRGNLVERGIAPVHSGGASSIPQYALPRNGDRRIRVYQHKRAAARACKASGVLPLMPAEIARGIYDAPAGAQVSFNLSVGLLVDVVPARLVEVIVLEKKAAEQPDLRVIDIDRSWPKRPAIASPSVVLPPNDSPQTTMSFEV